MDGNGSEPPIGATLRTPDDRHFETPKRLVMRLLPLCLLLLTSCSLGPKRIQDNRIDYNRNIQQSDSQELLLNLVRIRYSETPYFMQVSSISASFNYSLTLGADGRLNQGQESFVQYPMASLLPSVRGSVAENPTITFSPVIGEQFVKQLLADITPSRFWFLHRAGWEMGMLLNVLTRGIGRLENPDHYQLTSEAALAKRREFQEFIALIEAISARGDLGLLYTEASDAKPWSLIMQFRFADEAEARRLGELLGAPIETRRPDGGACYGEVLLSESLGLPRTFLRTDSGVILPLLLRNFIGVLVYLDAGVAVPREHIEQGIVHTAGAESDFDTQSRYIRVRHSVAPPPGAMISVSHHGVWFSIMHTDFDSKRTFAFVQALLALQSGKVTGTLPVLTLPVSK